MILSRRKETPSAVVVKLLRFINDFHPKIRELFTNISSDTTEKYLVHLFPYAQLELLVVFRGKLFRGMFLRRRKHTNKTAYFLLFPF